MLRIFAILVALVFAAVPVFAQTSGSGVTDKALPSATDTDKSKETDKTKAMDKGDMKKKEGAGSASPATSGSSTTDTSGSAAPSAAPGSEKEKK
jgi:hypothetical protein